MSQFEDMPTYNDKTDVILVFNCDIREPITTAAETNYDDEGYGLIKAASILRIQELLENILNDSFSVVLQGFSAIA